MPKARRLYEPAADWRPRLPEEVVLGYTHGVAEDALGRLFVFNMSRHAVVALDAEGGYLFSWGEAFAAGAHGLCLHREADGREYLYLTDIARHLVAKYTLDGQEVLQLERPPASHPAYPAPERFVPTDVGVAPNGDIYVVDGYGQYYVHRYDASGKWLTCWGGKGSGNGQLHEPHGLWIDERGAEPLVIVADRRNQRFPCFTMEGELVRTYAGDYLLPCDLVGDGERYYIPDLNGRVTIADAAFNVIGHIGESDQWEDPRWPDIPEAEWTADRFVSPHALCVDRHGDLLVVEWVPGGRVTRWRPVEQAV